MKPPSYGQSYQGENKQLQLNSEEAGAIQGQVSWGASWGKNTEQSMPKIKGKVRRDRILIISKWVNLNVLAQKNWEQYRSIAFSHQLWPKMACLWIPQWHRHTASPVLPGWVPAWRDPGWEKVACPRRGAITAAEMFCLLLTVQKSGLLRDSGRRTESTQTGCHHTRMRHDAGVAAPLQLLPYHSCSHTTVPDALELGEREGTQVQPPFFFL